MSIAKPISPVTLLFGLLHVAAAAALFVPPTTALVLWLVRSYPVRMFGVTAGYHRYFSHRSYKLGSAVQFLLAFLAETSGQKGVLWWAAQHRIHHRESDTERDIHSPWTRNFWWAHLGWILSCEMSSCAQGLRWWEIDATYWVLRLLSAFGIARELKPFRPPRAVKEAA